MLTLLDGTIDARQGSFKITNGKIERLRFADQCGNGTDGGTTTAFANPISETNACARAVGCMRRIDE